MTTSRSCFGAQSAGGSRRASSELPVANLVKWRSYLQRRRRLSAAFSASCAFRSTRSDDLPFRGQIVGVARRLSSVPSDKSQRAFACRIATKSPTRTRASYSSRSSGVSIPSVDLSASSSIRSCICWSARTWINASTLCRSRRSATAPRTRSKTMCGELAATI